MDADNLLWVFFVAAARAVAKIDQPTYFLMLALAIVGCVAVRLAPARARPMCALPYLAGAALWALASHAQGRPELLALSLISAIPLPVWAGRAFKDDPMRALLMDEEPGAQPKRSSRLR